MHWLLIAIAGFGLAVLSARWALRHAAMLAHGLALPPFLIGVTFVAIGTDLPEIANSVSASLAGHGDLNVGDSIGSVVTQITLVLGLLPFAGGMFLLGSRRFALVSSLTLAALGLGAWLVADGYLSRGDAVALLAAWVVATSIAWRWVPPSSQPELEPPTRHRVVHGAAAVLGLLLVAAGATAAVQAMIALSALAGVPEYVISFFGSSIGTSLPELVVTVTAIRRGQRDLAFGDVVGACLLDATVSIAAGPLIAPTAVTADLAVLGALLAITAVLLVTAILWSRRRHDRVSGAALLLLYGATFLLLT